MIQIAFAVAVSLVNIALHAVASAGVMRVLRWHLARHHDEDSPRVVRRMISVVTVLNIAHIAEVCVWATAYWLVGASPAGTDNFYFAFVNFATLGYGDVTPVLEWRVIGPMTALNGALLMGWSTAVIFAVLSAKGDLPDLPERRGP